jgi:hypothetical protein
MELNRDVLRYGISNDGTSLKISYQNPDTSHPLSPRLRCHFYGGLSHPDHSLTGRITDSDTAQPGFGIGVDFL